MRRNEKPGILSSFLNEFFDYMQAHMKKGKEREKKEVSSSSPPPTPPPVLWDFFFFFGVGVVVGQVGKLGKNGCGSRDRESIQKNGDQLGWGRGGGPGRLIIGPASGKKVWRVRLQQCKFFSRLVL